MSFEREERKLGPLTLLRHLGRMSQAVRGRGVLLSLCVLLSLVSAGLEMGLPLVVRDGLDRFVLAPWLRVDLSSPEDREWLSLNPERLVDAGDGVHAFLETQSLSREERAELESRHILDAEGWFRVSDGSGESDRFISEAQLRALPAPERAHLREGDRRGVFLLACLYLAMLLCNFFASYGASVGLNRLGQSAVLRMRSELWRHIHRLPIKYFDENPVGRLVTRVTNDSAALSDLFSSVIATALADVVLFFGILVILWRLDAALTLRLFLLAPPLILLAWWFRRASGRLYREVRVQVAKVNTFLQESVQGIAVLKAFGREREFSARFREINDEFFRVQMRLIYVFAVFRPLIDAFAVSAIAVVVWYGGGQTLRNQLSVGTLVAFLLYLKLLFMPLQDLAEKFNILQSAVVASERLFGILDTPPEPSGRAERGDGSGEVRFEDVSFAYESGAPVLDRVSFSISAGQSVALVGPTGSGKTTLASLLLGFYPLQEGCGEIFVEGRPLHDWSVEALRARFAFVPQDLFLFSGTLGHNVTLFSELGPEEVSRAAEGSRLSAVLNRLPKGLAHPLNERGTVLSQGERQLVSFARALAHPGQILILDEATASVDSSTEALIQQAMRELLRGRTSLIIAHRLSTVQEADLILVLKKGRIAERGTHAELMATGGLYSHLYRTQFAKGL